MIEHVDQSRQSNLLTPCEYRSGDTTIQIRAREFLPFKENDSQQEALVLFPGWGPNEKASSYNELGHSLADSFGRRVLLINTRAKNLIEDSLYHEAAATHKFLEEMNITDTILAGYSEGGAKAVNLAVISQETSTINPEALILLAPTGVDAQTPSNLVKTFALDTVGQTIPHIITERVIATSEGEQGRIGKVRQSLNSAVDIIRGVAGEVSKSKAGYPKRFAHEVKEMSKINPKLKELKIPVILVQGKYDKPTGPKGDLTQEQMANQDSKGSVKQALQEIFKSSPYVNRILARRTGKHDFVLLRSPQIARVVNYLLERQSRA